ncbi:MAG TPA: prepilin-type N-terminal cleavage/methylation domain-containing protein [Gemmatimonadales bacterium]|nr:prepilin-type N-terminal cleavage/methylation domain-containing protein [Gemmatimonadales bacterium]
MPVGRGPRSGFTLVELLITLVLLLLVGGITYQVIITQQRVSRRQAEQVALQANIRTGALVLPNELRELGHGASGTDLLAMHADSITYRAMRAVALACRAWQDSVWIRGDRYFGYRQPVAGRDSVFLFVDGNPATSTDDRWVALGLQGVAPAGGTCAPGVPARRLRFTTPLSAADLAGVVVEAPLRTYEIMQVKEYVSNGQNWLGARSISAGETVQPVLGPLAADGLTLTYRDSTGAVTTVRGRVRTIQVTIRGVTDEAVRNGAGQGALAFLADSLVTTVALRNTPGL